MSSIEAHRIGHQALADAVAALRRMEADLAGRAEELESAGTPKGETRPIRSAQMAIIDARKRLYDSEQAAGTRRRRAEGQHRGDPDAESRGAAVTDVPDEPDPLTG